MPSWGQSPTLENLQPGLEVSHDTLVGCFITAASFHLFCYVSHPHLSVLPSFSYSGESLIFFSDLDRCDHFKTSSSFIYSVFSFTPNNSTNVRSSRKQQMGNARCYGDNLPTKCGPPSCWRCGPRLHLSSL